jgi:hypothetical protein
MEYKNDFSYDLKFGHIGEQLLAEIFSGKKVEVKRDTWICKSRNLAIEYESRGNPSGIAVSVADYWCFIISGEMEDKMMLLVEIGKLKEISRKYYKKGNIKSMGDENTSKAVLIPFCELLEI